LLDKDSAIKQSDDVVRIESSATASTSRLRISKPKGTPVAVPLATAVNAPTDVKLIERSRNEVAASTIEQAILLRDILSNAAKQANELAKSLKLQKRQSRIVESTEASLRQLQKVAG
jgi:hypothetical protein